MQISDKGFKRYKLVIYKKKKKKISDIVNKSELGIVFGNIIPTPVNI